MTDIIVNASPVYGHFAPMRSIAVDLMRRGHQVTMVTGSRFGAEAKSAGLALQQLRGDADFDFSSGEGAAERMAVEPGLARFEWDMRNTFVRPIREQHDTLQAMLAQLVDRPVVVLSEVGFLGMVPTMLGAPGLRPSGVIGVGVVPFAFTSIDTAAFGTGLPPDDSEAGRARNRETNAFMRDTALRSTQKLFESTLTELGVPGPFPFFLDSPVLGSDHFLQLSIEELSYRRSDTPAHVDFIGTLPTVSHANNHRPAWWADVEQAETVVVVTQGTVANHDFTELIQPTLDALADLPVLVVATTGRPADLARVPGNARIVEFVSFDDLLPHTDVLVTNGGFGAVQQALSHGTPMVLAGTTEDKLEGNARTAATGAAINLGVDRPSPEDIRKAVLAISETVDYKKTADRLAAEYAEKNALETIAEVVAKYSD